MNIAVDDPLGPYRAENPLEEAEIEILRQFQRSGYLHGVQLTGIPARLSVRVGMPESEFVRLQDELTFAKGDSNRTTWRLCLGVRIALAMFGENHPRTLECIKNLAVNLRDQDRKRALPLFEAVLAGRRRRLGSEHSDTIESLDDVARCYEALGQARRARPLFEKVVEYRKVVFGPEHPDTLSSLDRLAGCLVALGDSREALPLFEQIVAGFRRVLGDDHHDTLVSLNNLALCHRTLGNGRLALQLNEEALANHRRVFGEDDPDTLRCLVNVAACYRAVGDARSALPLYEKVFAKLSRILGEDHPDTLVSLNNLAVCHRTLGDARRALLLYEQVLAKRRSVLGDDHSGTLTSLNNLASCHLALGDARRALPLFEQASAGYRRVLGDDHPRTLKSRHDLAACLRFLGNSRRALPLIEQALAGRLRLFGEDHPDTLGSLRNLAWCHSDLGDTRRALPLFEQALAGYRRVCGDHPDTFESLNDLARCYQVLDDARRAVPLFEQALIGNRRTLGDDHPDTLRNLHHLAACHADLGDYLSALPLFAQDLASVRRVLGEDHPDTLMVFHNLAKCHGILGNTQDFRNFVVEWFDLVARNQKRDGVWPEMAARAAESVSPLIIEDPFSDWQDRFLSISRAFVEDLDTADIEVRQRMRDPFRRMHGIWLALCLQFRPEDIPQVLAALQGREMAALLLQDLEARQQEFTEGDPRRRYLEVVLELRTLRLRLGSDNGLGTWNLVDIDRPRNAEAKRKLDLDIQKRHDEVYKEFQSLRHQLANLFPEFGLTRGRLDADTESLAAKLSSDSALVLLFSAGNQGDTEKAVMAWILRKDSTPIVTPLPGLETVSEWTQAFEKATQERNRRGWRLRFQPVEPDDGDPQPRESGKIRTVDFPQDPQREFARSPDQSSSRGLGLAEFGSESPATALDSLVAEFQTAFWTPLVPHLHGIRTVHLVTHDVLHGLPLEQGAPEDLQLQTYPGLLFYYQCQHLSDPLPQRPRTPEFASPMLAVHTDPASDTNNPIPFVAADARIAKTVWGAGAVHTGGPETRKLWEREPQQTYPLWSISCHGDERKGPPTETVLILDHAANSHLDCAQVLASGQRPRIVVLGVCVVGRVHEDEQGEPLGLVSALFLRGAEYVVAPLQPVPDFYMPLFTCLFHQAWKRSGNPAEALADTKARLRSRRWFEDTGDLLEAAYRPVMQQVLESAVTDPKAAWSIVDWPLPEALAKFYAAVFTDPKPDRSRLEDFLAREKPIDAVLDRLIRHPEQLPDSPLRHLTVWIRGFGKIRE
ncbi:MAG: tetratricopeptide repeat protein [Methylococcales bacterium]